MNIERQIDVEEEVRRALDPYITTYCRPLPAQPKLPCVLVQQVGGSAWNRLNGLEITLDARAKDDATALDTIRNAVGLLTTIAKSQETALCYAEVNTIGAWDNDPVRPDLAMCSARLTIRTHPETHTMEE